MDPLRVSFQVFFGTFVREEENDGNNERDLFLDEGRCQVLLTIQTYDDLSPSRNNFLFYSLGRSKFLDEEKILPSEKFPLKKKVFYLFALNRIIVVVDIAVCN